MPVHSRYIAFGEELDYGTAVVASEWLDIVSESLRRKLSTDTTQPARRFALNRQLERRRNVSGSIDTYSDFIGIGSIFKGFLGSPATSSLGGGAYAHVFSCNTNSAPVTWTVYAARDEAFHTYTGVTPTKCRVSFGLSDNFFGVSLDCIGKDESDGGALSSVPDNYFRDFTTVDKGAMALSIDDGSTNWTAYTQSIDIQMSSNKKLRESDRSQTPQGIIQATQYTASLKGRWVYGSDTEFLLDAFRNRTPCSLAFSITGSLISGVTYRKILIQIPNAMLNGDPPTIKGAGRGDLPLDFDFVGLESTDTANGPFNITLTNTTSAY